jgi:hypothetical protein
VMFFGYQRKAVNQAAHAPRPCRIVTIGIFVTVELVETYARVLLAVHGIFGHLVMAEGHLHKSPKKC